MKKLATIFILLFAAISAFAQTRFVTMDLIIDPKGEPLAAYQVEITAPAGVKFVGIEGGQHPEFRKTPFYDPKAMQSERLIVAAFSEEDKHPHRLAPRNFLDNAGGNLQGVVRAQFGLKF